MSSYGPTVSGTTSLDEQGKLHAPGDGYEQAKRCLEIIEKALLQLGVSLPKNDLNWWSERIAGLVARLKWYDFCETFQN